MDQINSNKAKWFLPSLVAVGAVVLCATPFVGMYDISLTDVFGSAESGVAGRIFWNLRVPRVVAAFLAGAALSLGGMCFQSLFRNSLATPYTLGVSSGAALGVSLALYVGVSAALGAGACAFAGALVAISLVYGLTHARGGSSTATMLLAGVALSFTFSSLLLFIHYISRVSDSFRMIRWLMGGVEVAGMKSLLSLGAFALVGAVVVWWHTGDLNLLAVGEEFAASRGADVPRVKLRLFLAVSLMVAGVVAICGPIGFVGMVCPHICRLAGGRNHRRLAFTAPLFGGVFLVLCDTLARTVIAPAEIPVGVVTALLGGPFFLWLLLSRRRIS